MPRVQPQVGLDAGLLASPTSEAENESGEPTRVDDESWTSALAADPGQSPWHVGDFGLVAFFVLVGVLLIGITLWPGFEVARAAQCKEDTGCTYTAGVAVGGAPVPNPLTAAAAEDEQGCCSICKDTMGCTVATYLNATGACLLYATDRRVPFAGAAVCALAGSDTTDPVDATRALIQLMLGASAVFTRFGGFIVVYIVNKLQGLVGYAGASLPQSFLTPREAAITASALRTAKFVSEGRGQLSRASAASWDAIAEPATTPPVTWTEARRGLGLSVRQAVWTCGIRLVLYVLCCQRLLLELS